MTVVLSGGLGTAQEVCSEAGIETSQAEAYILLRAAGVKPVRRIGSTNLYRVSAAAHALHRHLDESEERRTWTPPPRFLEEAQEAEAACAALVAAARVADRDSYLARYAAARTALARVGRVVTAIKQRQDYQRAPDAGREPR